MPIYRNFLLVVVYGAAAIAAAWWLPGRAGGGPVLWGALVLLLGVIGHLQWIRMHERRAAAATLERLEAAQARQTTEIEAMRTDLERLQAASRGSGRPEPPGRGMSEIIAEVRVLQSLIERLDKGRVPAADRSLSGNEVATAAPLRAEPEFALARRRDGRSRGGVRPGTPMPEAPLPAASAPADLDEARLVEIVRDGLKSDRIGLYLQPIVSLPQRKRRYYECFSRIRAADGAVITPEQYLPVAARAGLIDSIDNLLLFRCIQLVRKARHRHHDVGFFCNISANNLQDREFLSDFVGFMGQNQELAPHLFFEFAQADVARFDRAVGRELARLADFGFRYSMDRVSDLKLDLRDLRARHFAFVKLEAGFLLDSTRGERPTLNLKALKNGLDRANLDLIVEKIETERELVELLDHNIDFGQGYLFGEPRQSREI